MTVFELVPLPDRKVLFKLSSFKDVPIDKGCYVLTTFDGQILYVGLSDNLNTRFTQHLNNPEKTHPTSQGRAIWFYFMSYNPKNLQHLERTWLNHYYTLHGKRPLLNKVDSPI